MVQDLAYRINRENHKYIFYIYKEHMKLEDLVCLMTHCATEMKIKSSLSMQYVLAFRNRLLGLGILVNHLKKMLYGTIFILLVSVKTFQVLFSCGVTNGLKEDL